MVYNTIDNFRYNLYNSIEKLMIKEGNFMDIRLTQEQKQSLAPKLIQAAHILQLNQLELNTFIQEVSLENPLIELDSASDSSKDSENTTDDFEWMNKLDMQNLFYSTQDYEEATEDWNFSVRQGDCLTEHLLAQLPFLHLAEDTEIILKYLILSLDSKGYFTDPLDDFCMRFSLRTNDVLRCLSILQSLDPAGIGARNLSECLLLQLNRLNKDYPIAKEIVTNHLEQLAKNQLPQLASQLDVSISDIYENYTIILQLNPKPGGLFLNDTSLNYLYPDIIIKKNNDRLDITLNETNCPSIRINSYYMQMLKKDPSPDIQEYLQAKLNSANWIIQCIHKRNRTLYLVAKTLVSLQADYFISGPGHLHPLRLHDIASPLRIHDSTVSRAIKNKYLQCPWGVFPLHYFFSNSIKTITDSKTPNDIKTLIHKYILSENKQEPISDQKIVDLLSLEGIYISRRTVAKYRNELGIKDSRGRKLFQ